MGAVMTPAAILQQRWGDRWLATAAAAFWSQLAAFQVQFQSIKPQNMLLAEPDPVRFLAAFFAAAQQPGRLWLANPHWGQREWSQVAAQCQPDWAIGSLPDDWNDWGTVVETRQSLPLPDVGSLILIPTGGSSGDIRFAVHTWDTLAASVQGFCQHFGCRSVNAYCVLPLYHVSGLMQAMRCLLTGGQLVIQSGKKLLNDGGIASVPSNSFLSLVPTQLQRLLVSDRDFIPWLRQFHAILLGGAPPWPSLLQTARDLQLPLAPTYGMTETASQVATLLPSEFLAGQTGSGRSLPHAHLTILNDGGNSLPPQQVGKIAIAASSLALANGQTPIRPPFQTGDWGYLDKAGFLHVVGRETTLILTGGEKVLPEEVEASIWATGLVQDCAVLGVADADWGERVVAVIVTAERHPAPSLRAALQPQLSPYKIPKQWLIRADLPRNAQGKLNRAALRQWVMAQLGSTTAATEAIPESEDDAGG